MGIVSGWGGELVVNARSGRAAVKVRARSLVDDEGVVHRRVGLQRPLEKTNMLAEDYDQSHWRPVDAEAFGKVWSSELRSEEHTSELQSLMRISYAVFCLKKKNTKTHRQKKHTQYTALS